MEDLKKVQEFFSKPMGEGYYEFDMEDEGPDYNSISSLEDELRRLIRFSNQYGSKGADAKIEQLKQRIAQLKNQVDETKDIAQNVGEELDLSNPEFTDSGLQMYLINLNKELSYYLGKGEAADLRYAEMLKKDIADAKAELDRRIKSKKGTNEAKQETGVDMAKKQLDALGVKYEMSKTDKVRPFKVIYQPINKSDEFYDKFENIVDLFNLKGVVKSSMNEAKQEDPTDIIAMDVPLFLRMLEYAREDAEQDIDLHKVTERAIEAVKLRGLLSMEDYQDIVGEPIDEMTGYSKYLATPENPKGKTQGLTQDVMDKILLKIATMGDDDVEETTRLGEGVIYEELCPKGKAYIKKRQAAGEKSSAYLSGRAVKVCKGQMKG